MLLSLILQTAVLDGVGRSHRVSYFSTVLSSAYGLNRVLKVHGKGYD